MTASADETLLLVHGWGMNARVWDGLRARLAPGVHCLAPELPGHGTRADEVPAGFDAVARELLERLPETGGTVLGWSLGGLLALRMAALDPARVRRLLLVATTPRFVQAADWPHALSPEVLAAFAGSFAAEPVATLRRFFALQTRGAELPRERLHALRAAMLDHPPSRPALAAGLEWLAGQDLRATLAGLDLPVAWLLGGRDRIVPAAVARDLVRLAPRAALEVWTRCAHLPFVEEEAGFADWLRGWMEDTA